MKKPLLLLFAILLIPVFGLNAQTQLTDFKYQDGDKGSNPSNFVMFNNLIFFQATTGSEGRELWVSGGQSSNTRILKDINPGNHDGVVLSFKQSSVILKDQLFFIANDGENGSQIWSTKGTEQTTKRITSILGLNSTRLTLVGNQIYFLVKRANVLEVWKSNGTTEGTVMVKGGLPIWNQPSFEGSANHLFFFAFQPEGSNDLKLWRSDGTESGTFSLGGTSSFTQYFEFKNELYFVTRSSTIFPYPTTVGIMKTDGTLENTVPVKAVHDGNSRLLNYADITEVNGKLYFSFFEVNYNRLFIWESDGMGSGTKKIYDAYGSKYFSTSNLSTDGKHLVFVGGSNNSETALLKLNLDTYKVEEVKGLAENVTKPFIFYSQNHVYRVQSLPNGIFLVFDPIINSAKGWISDLTTEKTVPLSQLKGTREAITLSDNVYFAGYSAQTGNELWTSDVAFTNPKLLLNINHTKYALDFFFFTPVVTGDKIFFQANDGVHGSELWVYNLFTKEKHLVKDIVPGSNSSFPNYITEFNNDIYFTVQVEGNGSQLWRSDGTEKGTVRISNLDGVANYSRIEHLTVSHGKLFFVVLFNNRYVLCATGGTGTEKIKEFGANKNGVGVKVKQIASTGDNLFFTTEYADAGDGLWVSDGSVSGTSIVKSFFNVQNLTAVNSKVYFSAIESYQGEAELWQSNGTATGTAMVVNIGQGYSSDPANFFSYNGQLVFSAYTREFGREYWKTDGTPSGTTQIADINPGAANSVTIAPDYGIYNGHLYFAANDGSHGTELWRTDGTTSGTTLVSDINKGITGSFPRNLKANEEGLFFSAFTPENGNELWTTYGTASSTKQLFDINTGPQSSNPSNFLLDGTKLVFLAETLNYGRQLWESGGGNTTNIGDPAKVELLDLFPNPASEYIYMRGNKPFKVLKLLNLNGQSIPFSQETSNRIHVGNLPSGMYMLVTEFDKKVVVKKFIKK